MASSGDNSQKLELLNRELREKEQSIAIIQEEYQQKIQILEHSEQELKLSIEKLMQNNAKDRKEYEEKLKTANSVEKMLREHCEVSNSDNKRIRDELTLKIGELENTIEQKESLLRKMQEEIAQVRASVDESKVKAQQEVEDANRECMRKLEEVTTETLSVRNALAEKSQELLNLETSLRHEISIVEQREIESKTKHEEVIRKLEFELTENNSKYKQLENEMILLRRDCQNVNTDVSDKNARLVLLAQELERAQALIKQLEEERNTAECSQAEEYKKLINANERCEGLVNELVLIQQKAEAADKLASELQMEKNNYEQIVQQLAVTVEQKEKLLELLQTNVNKSGGVDSCRRVLDIANGIQVVRCDEKLNRIIELETEVENLKNRLQQSGEAVKNQQNEILRLQEELVKVSSDYPSILLMLIIS